MQTATQLYMPTAKELTAPKRTRNSRIAVNRIEAELSRAPLFDAPPAIVQRELI